MEADDRWGGRGHRVGRELYGLGCKGQLARCWGRGRRRDQRSSDVCNEESYVLLCRSLLLFLACLARSELADLIRFSFLHPLLTSYQPTSLVPSPTPSPPAHPSHTPLPLILLPTAVQTSSPNFLHHSMTPSPSSSSRSPLLSAPMLVEGTTTVLSARARTATMPIETGYVG
jgi:hypothetical protein